jgi:hypothetical protein
MITLTILSSTLRKVPEPALMNSLTGVSVRRLRPGFTGYGTGTSCTGISDPSNLAAFCGSNASKPVSATSPDPAPT